MQYRGQPYVSVQFLKDNELISDPSVFFKCIPQKHKLKVVSSSVFNQLQEVKDDVSRIEEVDVALAPWVVSVTDPEVIDVDNPEKFDYQDFITSDFYKSANWVGYNKRTKTGG